MESEKRLNKMADHSRLVDDGFNKQGYLFMRLLLRVCKMSRSSLPPIRILKVYMEALTGFGNVYHPDGLNNLLCQGYVLENSSHCRNGGQSVYSQGSGGDKNLSIAWV